MELVFSMKGVQDLLEVYPDHLAITPQGVLGFMNKGLKGTKEIPYTSITAVQHRPAGPFVNGFLQFTIPGGNESKGGIFAAVKDENTFVFSHKADSNEKAIKIKEYIDTAVKSLRTTSRPSATHSVAAELEKLAALRDSGILTPAEFEDAKRKVLS